MSKRTLADIVEIGAFWLHRWSDGAHSLTVAGTSVPRRWSDVPRRDGTGREVRAELLEYLGFWGQA